MAFVKVADLGEIGVGTAREVELGGEQVCLVRTGEDTVKAVHNVCSHQYYELSEGYVELDPDSIECSLHGSTFNLDTGNPDSLPAVTPIPVYACRVDGDEVLVDIDQQLNDAPVPRH